MDPETTSTWEDNFDINGTGGFIPQPEVAWNAQPPVVPDSTWVQPSNFDQVMIDPTTHQMQMADGTPLSPAMESSIRQAYPDLIAPAGGGLNSSPYGPPTPESQAAMETALEQGTGWDKASTEAAIKAAQDPGNADPGILDKLGKALSDPSILAKLLVTGGAAAVSMLASKLLANPATAPSGRKIQAQMNAMLPAHAQAGQAAITSALNQGGGQEMIGGIKSSLEGQNAYQQNLANAFKQQGPGEQAIRNQSLGQVARVMAGQYSNPMLDMQSQLEQEKLNNESAQKGLNSDWLTQSTAGQRGQMFKNLQDQILREQDRRATLAQMLPVASTYGTAMTPNLGLATQQPAHNPLLGLRSAESMGSQAGSYLQNAQMQQYLAQNKANEEMAKGVGGVVAEGAKTIASGV
jgi:hypothetical protein